MQGSRRRDLPCLSIHRSFLGLRNQAVSVILLLCPHLLSSIPSNIGLAMQILGDGRIVLANRPSKTTL